MGNTQTETSTKGVIYESCTIFNYFISKSQQCKNEFKKYIMRHNRINSRSTEICLYAEDAVLVANTLKLREQKTKKQK